MEAFAKWYKQDGYIQFMLMNWLFDPYSVAAKTWSNDLSMWLALFTINVLALFPFLQAMI